MDNKVAPCKGCAERHSACHDHCAKYAEWKAEYQTEEALKKEYKQQRREDYLRSEESDDAKRKFAIHRSRRKL